MKRVHGSDGMKALECVNPRYQKWIVRWDIQPYYNEENEQQGVQYYEQWVTHKPSIDEVKEIVLSGLNNTIDENILSGFVWNDMSVWLSTENQFNYKAAYDLAVQSNGQNLPIVFKFGTTENPVYHTFTTVEELSDFYVKAMTYINTQLAQGWALKDSIDWTEYEKILG